MSREALAIAKDRSPLAHHGQVVTGVAEDGGLGALDAEEALEVAHGAALVDAADLQVRPIRARNSY